MRATIGMDLEGAWAAEEVASTATRWCSAGSGSGSTPRTGERFRITHPYGIDDIVADDRGRQHDRGHRRGAGRVRPGAEQPDRPVPEVGPGRGARPPRPVTSATRASTTRWSAARTTPTSSGSSSSTRPPARCSAQVGFTDLFSVQGRYATNSGVDLDQATYTLGRGRHRRRRGLRDQRARARPSRSSATPTLGYRTTRLRGSDGRYYGRFPVTGPVPAGTQVEVVNSGDQPGGAQDARRWSTSSGSTSVNYDADAQTLHRAGAPPATGRQPGADRDRVRPARRPPFTGVVAPPPTITVTSAARRLHDRAADRLRAGRSCPAAPVAAATADTPADRRADREAGRHRLDRRDRHVRVDADRRPAGDPDRRRPPPPPTFVPTAPGTYMFSLAVRGPGGTGRPGHRDRERERPRPAPRADAGADQTVVRGRTVTLDGSRVDRCRVVLVAAGLRPGGDADRRHDGEADVHLPGAGPAGRARPEPDVRLRQRPGGAGADRRATRPASRPTRSSSGRRRRRCTGLAVRYRTGNNEWRISGTSNLLAGQRVTAVLGSTLTGRVIGTPAAVDAAGAFSIRLNRPGPGRPDRHAPRSAWCSADRR